jgi:hypothetical protein
LHLFLELERDRIMVSEGNLHRFVLHAPTSADLEIATQDHLKILTMIAAKSTFGLDNMTLTR